MTSTLLTALAAVGESMPERPVAAFCESSFQLGDPWLPSYFSQAATDTDAREFLAGYANATREYALALEATLLRVALALAEANGKVAERDAIELRLRRELQEAQDDAADNLAQLADEVERKCALKNRLIALGDSAWVESDIKQRAPAAPAAGETTLPPPSAPACPIPRNEWRKNDRN